MWTILRSPIAFVLLFVMMVRAERSFGQNPAADGVLAVVNGTSITQGDLDFLILSRRIPQEQTTKAKDRLLEILIERQLMREFLASRKAKPSQTELEEQVARILKLIRDGGDDPEKVLARM